MSKTSSSDGQLQTHDNRQSGHKPASNSRLVPSEQGERNTRINVIVQNSTSKRSMMFSGVMGYF